VAKCEFKERTSMAIFGDLNHLPFIDLTRVLAHQTGTLFLRTAFAGRSVELHLDRTELRGLYLDGFPINESSRIQDILHGLVTSVTGTFEFQPAELASLLPHLKLTLSELLEPHGGTAVPEAQLPHADTHFMPAELPLTPPVHLTASWQRVRPRLEAGASPADVAHQLQLSELQGRELFSRLRTAGLIVPVRGNMPAKPNGRTVAPDVQLTASGPDRAAPEAGPVGRLLNALRRFTAAPGRA